MDNPIKTRSDLGRLLIELLEPLKKHTVPGGFSLGNTCALYPPKIAAMEGWSRCLWGICPYIAGGGEFSDIDEVISTMSRGVDPKDDAYWGECGPRDQKLVEMASIAMCLLLAPKVFWQPLGETDKQNLYKWLSQIEKCELPPSNWHGFRLLVCAAFRSLGLSVDEQAESESFNVFESCYRVGGWYQDGEGQAYDSYNAMGFHFYGIVLAAFAVRQPDYFAQADKDGIYKRFLERAKEFGPRFTAWFHHDGSMIPYGRSLTYRFAPVSFFSACAFAGLEVIPWGQMKGIVLRNLRYWFSQQIFYSEGVLSIGYNYPNLIMADAYNSPGSPYWALKAFLILALGDDHPFWQAEELPLPSDPVSINEKAAGFIVSRSAEDAQLLAAGRQPSWDINHVAQKYCKFAYSARFGFCVSHSSFGIDKCGCDSTLLLSEGDGYWRECREILERETGEDWIKSRWQPWPDVGIVTILIRLGDWHLRIHGIQSSRRLQTVEGGFSVSRLDGDDLAKSLCEKTEANEALIAFSSGASRIADLDINTVLPAFSDRMQPVSRNGTLVYPAPNLNIIHPLVVVPVLEGIIKPGLSVLACTVRAGDSKNVCTEAVPLPGTEIINSVIGGKNVIS